MATPQRKQRVKNSTAIVIDGIKFTSKAEAYYYTILKKQLDNCEIKDLKLQEPFELQPQFKKCSAVGCNFIWTRPYIEGSPDYKRYYKARECPVCGYPLNLHREMTYISDFVATDLNGVEHVIDVKSSAFFQTEIFKMKKKIFEFKYPAKILETVYPKVPKNWGVEKVI